MVYISCIKKVVRLNPGTVYWMVSAKLAIPLEKIKVAKWGTPKKYLKKCYI